MYGDSELASDEFVLATAWRTALRLNRWGLLARSLCLVTLLAVVAGSGEPQRLVLLLPSLVGIALAISESYDDLLEAMPDGRFLGRLRRHLLGKRIDRIAGPSASGVLEASGLILSACAVVGPWPLPESGPVKAISVTAAILLTWDVLSQTVLDASWYNRSFPPKGWMVLLRWSIPMLAAGLSFILLSWPHANALPPVTALFVSAWFLFLWPWMGLLSAVLAAGAGETMRMLSLSAEAHAHASAGIMHQIKGKLKTDIASLDEHDPRQGAERRITERLLTSITLEWMRAMDRTGALTPAQIWEACCGVERIRAGVSDGRIVLRDEVGATCLDRPAAAILRLLMLDLTSNALAAGADRIELQVACVPHSARLDRVVVKVRDNGPGYAPTAYGSQTSLGSLQRLLGINRGSLTHELAIGGGTCVTAEYLAKLTKPSPSQDIRPRQPTRRLAA